MKRPDEAIDRVLEGLRSVEAPEGLEQRVLRGVSPEAGLQAGSRRRGVREVLAAGSGRRGAIWGGAALASVLGIGFAMFALDRARSDREGQTAMKSAVVVSEARGVAASVPLSGTGTGTGTGTGAEAEARGKGEARVRGVKVGRDGERRFRAERHGVGYPAPPLPLTAQEKLLLRVAHEGDPEEIAMLDVQARVKKEARQRAEFKEFFPEPPESEDQLPISDEK